MKIGIDLGTTNSALAYIDGREAEDRDFPPIHIFGFAFVDVGEGGVGGAEIDPDFHSVVQDWAVLCREVGFGTA